jgi:hypothetical protein
VILAGHNGSGKLTMLHRLLADRLEVDLMRLFDNQARSEHPLAVRTAWLPDLPDLGGMH